MSAPDYHKWWYGKYLDDGRKIVDIEWVGPPSHVYGAVVLHLQDGTRDFVYQGEAFKPRKIDLPVFNEPPVEGKTPPCGLYRNGVCKCVPSCRFKFYDSKNKVNDCKLLREEYAR